MFHMSTIWHQIKIRSETNNTYAARGDRVNRRRLVHCVLSHTDSLCVVEWVNCSVWFVCGRVDLVLWLHLLRHYIYNFMLARWCWCASACACVRAIDVIAVYDALFGDVMCSAVCEFLPVALFEIRAQLWKWLHSFLIPCHAMPCLPCVCTANTFAFVQRLRAFGENAHINNVAMLLYTCKWMFECHRPIEQSEKWNKPSGWSIERETIEKYYAMHAKLSFLRYEPPSSLSLPLSVRLFGNNKWKKREAQKNISTSPLNMFSVHEYQWRRISLVKYFDDFSSEWGKAEEYLRRAKLQWYAVHYTSMGYRISFIRNTICLPLQSIHIVCVCMHHFMHTTLRRIFQK